MSSTIFDLSVVFMTKILSSLYKLSYQNEDCQWTTLPQSLKFARGEMVAIAIADDFFYSN